MEYGGNSFLFCEHGITRRGDIIVVKVAIALKFIRASLLILIIFDLHNSCLASCEGDWDKFS